jgi:hypothetical protein
MNERINRLTKGEIRFCPEYGQEVLKMKTKILTLLTAMTLLIALAVPAMAAGWSQPVVLSTVSSSPVPAPQASANAAGNAVVVWADAAGVVRAAVRSTAGAWSAPAILSTNPAEAASSPVVAVRADGSAVVLWVAKRTSDAVIEYSSSPAQGGWSAPTLLDAPGSQSAGGPQVAVDGAGNLTAVWWEYRAVSTVYVATQTPGGSWSDPLALGTTGEAVLNLHVAVNPLGAAVVGWSTGAASRPHAGLVATRPIGGSFGAPVTLVTTGGRPVLSALGTFVVAIDQTGLATAAWDTAYTYAASQLPGGGWGAPVQLPSNPYADYVSIAIDNTGTALVVWHDARGFVGAARAAGGVWAAPAVIDPGAQTYPGAALVANGGTIFAVWDDLTLTPRLVLASSWTVSGGWSTTTQLDRLDDQYGYTPISVAPLGTGAVATWVNTNGAQAQIEASVYR